MFLDAARAISDWLQRPLQTITFDNGINLLTQEVQCPLIPDSARSAVKSYANKRSNRMFYGIFLYHVNGISDWDGVADACDNAIDEFDMLVSSLSDGEKLFTVH